MKLGYFLDNKLKKHLITVTFPNEIRVRFSSLYGLEKEKEILQDIIDYFNTNIQRPMPHSSYFITGPLGCGKASMVFALAKESAIPVVSIDCSSFRCADKNEVKEKLNLIFNTARRLRDYNGGCIIVFKNGHELEYMNDNSVFSSNLMKNIFNLKNIFMFMLTLGSVTLSAEIVENDLFTTTMSIDYPNLATREKLFKSSIKRNKLNLDANVSINRLAKDTIGQTPLTISYIVKEAQLYAFRKKHAKVTQSDFAEVIMKLSAGEKHFQMTEKEKKLTAYHEAGHVIAGYFSNPDYVLKRVEISPRAQGSLGLTATDIDENKYSYFKNDFENMIIECLGGMCAEEVVYGAHTSGVVSDLAQATSYAASMIGAYGMNDNITPLVLINGLTDSAYSRAVVEKETQKLLKDLLAKTTKIIEEHRPYLEVLASSLVEKEVVLGNEIEEIFDKVDAKLHEFEVVDHDDADIR